MPRTLLRNLALAFFIGVQSIHAATAALVVGRLEVENGEGGKRFAEQISFLFSCVPDYPLIS